MTVQTSISIIQRLASIASNLENDYSHKYASKWLNRQMKEINMPEFEQTETFDLYLDLSNISEEDLS